MSGHRLIGRLALLITVFAFCVVVLGAYVRLSDAGLGCPDWPGCYGQLLVPEKPGDAAVAHQSYPQRPLESSKAWKEMIHRYAASTLGLLILVLAVTALYRRRRDREQRVLVPLLMVVLVIFQGLLGMWTVTLLLKPAIVTAHLLGGMTILALAWWVALRNSRLIPGALFSPQDQTAARLGPWALLALLMLYIQISLGGWTSTNYAALICPDLPTCQGQWWPEANFGEAFRIWREVGVNYEFGVLDGAGRTAIHLSHRIGAVLTLLLLGSVGVGALRRRNRRLRAAGLFLLLALLAQISLGIANIVLMLPLPLAVAHNGGAALLLLAMVTVLHVLYPPRPIRI